VAKAITIAALRDMNGKCLFVAGGGFLEIEEGLEGGVQEWFGTKVGGEWQRGMQFLNKLGVNDSNGSVVQILQGSTVE